MLLLDHTNFAVLLGSPRLSTTRLSGLFVREMLTRSSALPYMLRKFSLSFVSVVALPFPFFLYFIVGRLPTRHVVNFGLKEKHFIMSSVNKKSWVYNDIVP